MGMFNSIYADLLCPVGKKISKDTEIQIKWQKQEARILARYHPGDCLEDLDEEFNNNWIRTEYICEVCSKRRKGRDGGDYISTDGQQWHYVFVHINQGRVRDILTEKEFHGRGVKDFVKDW